MLRLLGYLFILKLNIGLAYGSHPEWMLFSLGKKGQLGFRPGSSGAASFSIDVPCDLLNDWSSWQRSSQRDRMTEVALKVWPTRGGAVLIETTTEGGRCEFAVAPWQQPYFDTEVADFLVGVTSRVFNSDVKDITERIREVYRETEHASDEGGISWRKNTAWLKNGLDYIYQLATTIEPSWSS